VCPKVRRCGNVEKKKGRKVGTRGKKRRRLTESLGDSSFLLGAQGGGGSGKSENPEEISSKAGT